MSTGSAGTMGPPQGGEVFNATNPTVDAGIAAALTKFFASKGFTNLHITCTGINPTTASCPIMGTDPHGQNGTATATVAVNQQNGNLTITKIV